MLTQLVLLGFLAVVSGDIGVPLSQPIRYAPNGQPEVPVTGNVNHKRQVHPVPTGVNPQRPVGVIRPANNQVKVGPKRPIGAQPRPGNAGDNAGFLPAPGSHPGGRPLRQSASPPSGRPEFDDGFPEGFTRGLPKFDFQGRMPEPDSRSEGFMGDALANFPSLKSFGGFDRMPDPQLLAASVKEPRVAAKPSIRLPAPIKPKSGFRSS